MPLVEGLFIYYMDKVYKYLSIFSWRLPSLSVMWVMHVILTTHAHVPGVCQRFLQVWSYQQMLIPSLLDPTELFVLYIKMSVPKQTHPFY